MSGVNCIENLWYMTAWSNEVGGCMFRPCIIGQPFLPCRDKSSIQHGGNHEIHDSESEHVSQDESDENLSDDEDQVDEGPLEKSA